MPPKKKAKTACAGNGNSRIEQVFALKWEARKKIEELHDDDDFYVDCYTREECDVALQEYRRDVETEEEGSADAVYASRVSAMITAKNKFAELCEDYWMSECDTDSDEDNEDEEDEDVRDEEGEDVKEEHTGEVGKGHHPRSTPMMRPTLYETANGFEWGVCWQHADGHTMYSSVKVTVSALKVLP